MSLKSYRKGTSVKTEVRHASPLNPLALNPAELSHYIFRIKEENLNWNEQRNSAQLQEQSLGSKHMRFQGKQQ